MILLYTLVLFLLGLIMWLVSLRARTLDMMVLVAVAVGAGWLYSFVVTLTGGGDVFYEAAAVLSTFVLLGHWFEMRARGGANEAIRALIDLAPPKAVVLRDGSEVEIPTAEVAVEVRGDCRVQEHDTPLAELGRLRSDCELATVEVEIADAGLTQLVEAKPRGEAEDADRTSDAAHA